MSKSNKFSPEVRERAVRMVQEQRGEYPSLWADIESIAPKIGCVPQTLNRKNMGISRTSTRFLVIYTLSIPTFVPTKK